jgi:phosphatidylglycerophosphate synthase
MSSSFSDLADRLPPTTAFVEVGPEGGHARVVGGLSVLERSLWNLARSGYAAAVVAAEPLPLRADLPLSVQWVAPGSAPPEGASRVRGDEVQGARVVDEATARAAEWALCLTLAKSHQGLIDGWLNWRVSMPITRRLSSTAVMPNHVTLVSACIGAAASVSLLGGSWPLLALGGVLMQLQSILDSCDGELARLRFQGSRLGQWLDNLSDDALDLLFVVCAGIAAGGPWLTLAVVASVFRGLGHVVMYHEVHRRTGTGDAYSFRIWFQREQQAVDEVFGVRGVGGHLRALFRRDTYVFAWMLLLMCGQVEAVVVYGSILGVVIGGLMTLHLLLRDPLPPRR